MRLNNLIVLCLFVLMVHPDILYSQGNIVKGVLRNLESTSVKGGSKGFLVTQKSVGVLHQDAPNVLNDQRLRQSLNDPKLVEQLRQLVTDHKKVDLSTYRISPFEMKRPIFPRKSYIIPNYFITRQFVYGQKAGAKAFVSLTKKNGFSLFILDRVSVSTLKDMEESFSYFIKSNKENQEVVIRSYSLKPKEVTHILHHLDILQSDINIAHPVFQGDFSKSKINIESGYIDIIVPVADGKNFNIEYSKLLVRIMGSIPDSLRKILNKCLVEKVCTPDAVVIQLINDLINNNIKPEQVKCEFIQGIMAINDITETYDRNNFS